jgi:GNAT superfamily N-acetyltransferase
MSDVTVRAATPDDRDAVLTLLAASMGRDPADTRFASLFAWKHDRNPFGASPAWVATDGDRIAGFRVFMRWEFTEDGEPRRAVRAVDTATHPDYQGRGIFTRLTRHALDAMAADGVDFVFNTPNDQSRPGYLKMGWQEVGTLAVAVRPRGPAGVRRMLRARVPAEHWSAPSTAGEPAAAVLADGGVDELLAALPVPPGVRTRVSLPFLRWRYADPLLEYRAVVAAGGTRHGLALVRIRRRGGAREAVLCDVLTPGGRPRDTRALVRRVVRAVDADYVLRLDRALATPVGFVRLPGQGPVLTARTVRREPPVDVGRWHLTLGDVELF